MPDKAKIRIGGASGFWGESDMAVPQFLEQGDLDYIVFDYLAEITLSIMARARAKNPEAGYATDFVTAALKPNLKAIATQGVKIISNAGGVNPQACGEAVRALIKEAGLDLKVTVVMGDDLKDRAADFAAQTEMFSGEVFPPAEKIASINAYLGAFPIAEALGRGADIVITGRCVDSAVTLGACIHEFGWARKDWDKLSAGSLAGHIIECGPQATGGNFTDWELVADSLVEAGYPIAEISADGSIEITKPTGTGGLVSIGTVGEQMLYEIGDPQAYALPDVICDFSAVKLEQVSADRVRMTGAKGYPAPETYKTSVTWADGFRAGTTFFFVGENASAKARQFAKNALARAEAKLRRMNAPAYDETLVEVIGDGSAFGGAPVSASTDVAVKLAVKHVDARAAGLILREATGHALAAPPGLSGFSGGRPKPSPVVRLFSMLVDKSAVQISLDLGGETIALDRESGSTPPAIMRPEPPKTDAAADTEVPLIRLAWSRSGDKGDKANIGVLPRDPSFAPWIWSALSEEVIRERFSHYLKGDVERFYMPGTGAMNILLHDVLGGGGVASLRNDPQAKTYSQILLAMPIPVPNSIAEAL